MRYQRLYMAKGASGTAPLTYNVRCIIPRSLTKCKQYTETLSKHIMLDLLFTPDFSETEQMRYNTSSSYGGGCMSRWLLWNVLIFSDDAALTQCLPRVWMVRKQQPFEDMKRLTAYHAHFCSIRRGVMQTTCLILLTSGQAPRPQSGIKSGGCVSRL
jgi:hypothetical protein